MMGDASKLAERAVAKGAMQKISELSPLISFLKDRKLGTIVEIGTATGGTLWLWCQLATPDAWVISIDLPGGPFGGGYEEGQIPILKSYSMHSQNMHLLRTDSHDLGTHYWLERLLNGRAVDLLFIDADHSYRGVKKDFDLYSQFVKRGGFILFHDILHHPQMRSVEVARFWNEIKQHYKHVEFTDPSHDAGWGQWGGLGLIRYVAAA